MADLPKIKKKISTYVKNEDGKIAKQSIIALGAFLGSALASTILTAPDVKAYSYYTHANALDIKYDGVATGTHSNHASHSSHASY